MELLEEDERDEIPFSGIPDVISRYYIQFYYPSASFSVHYSVFFSI
jgi:hypothetical protein